MQSAETNGHRCYRFVLCLSRGSYFLHSSQEKNISSMFTCSFHRHQTSPSNHTEEIRRIELNKVSVSPRNDCSRQRIDHYLQRLTELSESDRQSVMQIWSFFGTAPGNIRAIPLDGLLYQCCMPQLSHLAAAANPLLRFDLIGTAPAEIAIRVFQYLDGKSLCHAAQVSRCWKKLADDDVVWQRMCMQHIDRKCKKCGWGLPLLDRKRKGGSGSDAKDSKASTGWSDGEGEERAVKKMKIDGAECTSSPTEIVPGKHPPFGDPQFPYQAVTDAFMLQAALPQQYLPLFRFVVAPGKRYMLRD